MLYWCREFWEAFLCTAKAAHGEKTVFAQRFLPAPGSTLSLLSGQARNAGELVAPGPSVNPWHMGIGGKTLVFVPLTVSQTTLWIGVLVALRDNWFDNGSFTAALLLLFPYQCLLGPLPGYLWFRVCFLRPPNWDTWGNDSRLPHPHDHPVMSSKFRCFCLAISKKAFKEKQKTSNIWEGRFIKKSTQNKVYSSWILMKWVPRSRSRILPASQKGLHVFYSTRYYRVGFQMVFQSGCSNLHSLQRYVRVSLLHILASTGYCLTLLF